MITRTCQRLARFSEDRRYRYALYIRWDATKPLLANIGLNPSTADEMKDDNTVRGDIARARNEDFGGLLKLNLFPIRATNPKEMLAAEDPFGPHWLNVVALLDSAEFDQASRIVCAWGEHGKHLGRASEFRLCSAARNIPLFAYGFNKSGEPIHTCYAAHDARMVPYLYRERILQVKS